MPNAPHFNDPENWRQRAEESRVLAEQMTDEAARKTILGIANDIARTLIRNAASEALPYRSSCLLVRTVSLSGRLHSPFTGVLSLHLRELDPPAPDELPGFGKGHMSITVLFAEAGNATRICGQVATCPRAPASECL